MQWLREIFYNFIEGIPSAHASSQPTRYFCVRRKLLWPLRCNGQAIMFYRGGFFFFLFSFFFLLSFFPGLYSQMSQIGCLPYFHTWCGLSANLESRSEMCCTLLAENTGRKNDAKIRHLRTIAQRCRAISSFIHFNKQQRAKRPLICC